MQRKKKSSIATKLISYIVPANFLVALAFSGFYLYQDYEQKKKDINKNIDQLKETTLPSLARALFDEDDDQIKTNIKGLIGHKDIAYLELTRVYEGIEDDKPEYKEGSFQKENSLTKKVDLYYAEEDQDKTLVGKITLIASLSGTFQFIKSQIQFISLIQILQFIIVTIIVFFLFKRLVSTHLADMSKYAESLDLEDLSGPPLKLKRPHDEKADELEEVVSSFNTMKNNLHASHEKLKDHNENLEDKIKQATKEIQDQNEKLKELDQKKTHFFQNISHELRTPLTLIMNPLEEAVKKFENENDLKLALKNSKRLYRLVNQLLDFQKLAAGKKELKLRPVNLLKFLNHCAQMFKVSVTYKKTNFTFTLNGNKVTNETIENEDIFMLGDIDSLEKIVFNYLSNALKYSKKEGQIHLDLSSSNKKVKISVKDDGIGISKENQKNLFQVFSLVDETSIKDFEGTGLGLALVKDLTLEMNGIVGIESSEGKGSTFFVEFGQFDFEIVDLLIAEDEEDICEIYETLLEDSDKINSYKIVPNAEEARALLTNHQFKCAVADAAMPGEDGASLLTHIYNHFPHTKRMLVTGNAHDKMLERAINLGKVDQVIFKPWDQEELVEIMEKYVEKSNLNLQEDFKFKGWQLSDADEIEVDLETSDESDLSMSGEKILIVEDLKDMRDLISRSLRRQGFQTLTANNGEDALEKLKNVIPDVIILDWMMPKMTGPEFIKVIKEKPNLSSIPTILLTAKSDEESRREGTKIGSDAYLGKPFNENELLNVVKNMIQLKQNISKAIETRDILDRLESSIFIVQSDLIIQSPVSKYSEELFGVDIVGRSIWEVLYFNVREGTRVHNDLNFIFSITFEDDLIQFDSLEHRLPKTLSLPPTAHKGAQTLKVSYKPLVNNDEIIEKIMFVVEELADDNIFNTEIISSKGHLETIKEILKTHDKVSLSKNLESSIASCFETLEDFISPLSDTYDKKLFIKNTKMIINSAMELFQENETIITKLDELYWITDDLDGKNSEKKIKIQIEASSVICDVIELLFQYSEDVNLFFPINFNFDHDFLNNVSEKVKDLDTIFKNFFEYVFLIRDVKDIKEEHFKKAVKNVALYPDFKRTLTLIEQRSRLISFLFKGMMEDELSLSYKKLSFLVRQMPESSKISKSIFQHNLITPYKEVLEKANYIESELPKRVEKRRKDFISELDYLLLLTNIMKRFVTESEKGPYQTLPKFSPIDSTMVPKLRNFIWIIEQSVATFDFQKEQNFIDKYTFQFESIIKVILHKELSQANVLPVERSNKKFISFLKENIPEELEDKAAS
ncbi:MAG: response regulator [Bdellovibrionota bacterium]|nr:response regulator [Bdellovibrionota bacterium]